MEKIKVFCPAKINLSLNVGKKREDGYHYIDSVMQSIDLGDYVTVMPRLDSAINLKFLNADIDAKNNSVIKAVDIIRKQFGDFGADITVEKHIPLSGGLGGSAAGAAGTIFVLDKLFSLQQRGLDIMAAARKAGSDVPFMLKGGCALVAGTGENIQNTENNLPLYFVVARKNNSGLCISGTIFNIFDELNVDGLICDNGALIKLLEKGDKGAYRLFSNALAGAAIKRCGAIEETLSFFDGALSANVSGSGDCVYACYESISKADSVAQKLKARGFEAYSCRSVNHGVKIV